VGTGIHPSVQEAAEQMVRYRQTFTPNPENSDLYRELYERVYTRMYSSLSPLYREIRSITGYP